MKSVNRFLAMVFCLMLCLSLLPANTVSAEAAEAELNWSVDGGELWISGEGAILPQGGEMPWKAYRSEITALRIDEGITEIPEAAFADCAALKSVSLPSSLRVIHKDAFRGCGRLFWVTFPEKLEAIGDGAFADCRGMNTVFIPNYVGSIGAAAFDSAVTINGVSGSASELYAIQHRNAFASVGQHKPFTGSGSWNGMEWTLNSGVLTISGSGAVSPEDGSRYPWESGRADITTLALEEGITAVESGAFRNCGKLKTVFLPESLTAIGTEAFAQCGALERITLPELLETIGVDAFDADLTLIAAAGSAAEKYAEENGLRFEMPEAVQPEEVPAETAETEAPEVEVSEQTASAVAEEPAPAETTPATEEEPAAEETDSEEKEESAAVESAQETEEEAEMAETASETEEEAAAEETAPEAEETEESLTEAPEEAEEAAEGGEYDYESLFTLAFDQVYAKPGDQVELVLSIRNNPGICALDLLLEYDHDSLKLESYSPIDADADWTVGMDCGDRVLLIAPEILTGDGEQLVLNFTVSDTEQVGSIRVQADDITVLGADESDLSGWASEPGNVVITASSAGDVNDDGEINGEDSLQLKAWLVGLTSEINNAAADVNGDGKVNLLDALHLDRYLLGLTDTLN